MKSFDDLAESPVPDEVMRRIRESFLDYLAVTCVGAKFLASKIARYGRVLPCESGAFRALGTGIDTVLEEAVFINGLNAHALDLDDGTNAGIIHLGSPIFSLLLPLAQHRDSDLTALLKAAVLGYETAFTLAVTIQPEHKRLGYHATGTCGVIGAVMAASSLLGLSPGERFDAFAAACMSAGGMLKALDEGSELKPYNVAKAALLALTSLRVATAGFRGPADPLGGRGFFKMMTGREDVAIRPFLLNGTYAVMKTYTKPYASCRYTHPAVDAALALREEVPFSTGDIDEILVETYDLAVGGHDHTTVAGSSSAKMSIPYATAVAWATGKAGLREFDAPFVTNTEILRLAKKVKVIPDVAMSARFPAEQPARLTVRAKGHTFRKEVALPKGEPENPLSPAEFHERYMSLMADAGVDTRSAESVYALTQNGGVKIKALLPLLSGGMCQDRP